MSILPNVPTITALLDHLSDGYQVFDLGCRVRPLDQQQVLDFEQHNKPYPWPWLHHAWTGWVMRHGDTHIIWFLQLPLDEQGQLLQASRDEFVQQWLLTLGGISGAGQQDAATNWHDSLKHSSLAFTPDEPCMAAFHTQASYWLGQAESQHFGQVLDYLYSDNVNTGWQGLALQGLADLARYLASDNQHSQQVARCLPQLPLPVIQQLALQCEHIKLHPLVTRAWIRLGKTWLHTTQTNTVVLILRALSQANPASLRRQWLTQLLHAQAPDIELLATIACKYQQDLQQGPVLRLFLAACASNQQVFNRLVGELMYQPVLRQVIMQQIRQPDRPDQLAAAFGRMIEIDTGT